MMSGINREYVVSQLVIDMINEVDRIRLVHTKYLIIYSVIQALIGIAVVIFGIVSSMYTISLLVLLNIATAILCVSRYNEFNTEYHKSYTDAREAIYGTRYESIYLNEEKMMRTYRDLCEMVRHVKCSIDIDRTLNIFIIIAQIFFIILIIFT